MSLDSFNVSDTIAAGAALGSGFFAGDPHLVHVFMPATWTAAALTFQTSPDGVTWQSAYDEAGTEISVVVAAGRNTRIPPNLLPATGWLRVRSGTAGTPVNQVAAATLTFRLRRYR